MEATPREAKVGEEVMWLLKVYKYEKVNSDDLDEYKRVLLDAVAFDEDGCSAGLRDETLEVYVERID